MAKERDAPALRQSAHQKIDPLYKCHQCRKDEPQLFSNSDPAPTTNSRNRQIWERRKQPTAQTNCLNNLEYCSRIAILE